MRVTPPPPPGATIDRDELTEDIAPADEEGRPLSLELLVLGNEPDGREWKHAVLVADLGPPFDDRRGTDGASASDTHVWTDHRIGPDNRAGADFGAGGHVRGRIDPGLIDHQTDQ